MSTTPPLDSLEFGRLLDRLALDIQDAAIFRKLDSDVNASVNEFWREFGQSQTFWSLSLQAYAETTLQRLSRIYVGHNDALTLGSWLRAIQGQPQLFPVPPEPTQLDQDMISVKDDPIVKKLIALRGNVLAHINWHNVAANLRLQNRFALTFDEMEVLIARALDILNRYSLLFKRTHWTTVISGHDDFRNILTALRYDLQRRRAQIDEDIIRATRAGSHRARRLRAFGIAMGVFVAHVRRRFEGA